MIYKCQEGYGCKYDGVVDTEGDKAYIMKEVNGETVAWHYMCRIGEEMETVQIPLKELEELTNYLKVNWFGKKRPWWVERVLQSL